MNYGILSIKSNDSYVKVNMLNPTAWMVIQYSQTFTDREYGKIVTYDSCSSYTCRKMTSWISLWLYKEGFEKFADPYGLFELKNY